MKWRRQKFLLQFLVFTPEFQPRKTRQGGLVLGNLPHKNGHIASVVIDAARSSQQRQSGKVVVRGHPPFTLISLVFDLYRLPISSRRRSGRIGEEYLS